MKRKYEKPSMRAVKIQQTQLICFSTESNAGITGGNRGGSGPARARSHSVWDDDWDEE